MIEKILRIGYDVFDLSRTGKYSYGELTKLKKIQYYNKGKLTALTNKNIEKIVKHAYNYVPFYRKIYRAEGIKLGEITGSKDLEKLPIITKSILRRNFPGNVIAKGFNRRVIYDRTSGSTGEPFEFYYDIRSAPLRLSAYMLFNTWMGVGINDKHIQISSPKHLSNINLIRNKVFQKYKISTLTIKRNSIKRVVDKINKINPKYLEGYSASLDNTARLIKEMNLELNIKPIACIATSEDLIEPHRKMIEDVFNTTVYNRYGSREFSGALAQECNIFEGLHVNTALCNIEIVDEEGVQVGEGERGRIIITDTNNYVMPFIRYDMGDSAIKGPEEGECGRVFPIIQDITGKFEYFLISRTDTKTPIETVASYLFQKYAPNVYRFQFIHNRKGNLILMIVPSPHFTDNIIEEIYRYLNTTLENFSFETWWI